MEVLVIVVILGLVALIGLAWRPSDDGAPSQSPSRDTWTAPRATPRYVPPPVALPTATFQAQARVIDGDTIEVRPHGGGQPLRVRFQDMDAPEHDQPEGPAASNMLRRILRSGACTVEPRGPDVYGRLVAKVRREDGKDVGLCMIAAGLAIAVGQAPRVYRTVERQARDEGRGAWARGGFEEPAAWRRAKSG